MEIKYKEMLNEEKIIYSVRDKMEKCPYNKCSVCAASFSQLRIDTLRNKYYCSSENYDDCPLFLSKLLRRS